MKQKLNIVWLKRDLRLQDHRPFLYAESFEDSYIPIYIFEPSLLAYPDTSLRHLQFIYHSLKVMNKQLQVHGRKVYIFHAEADEVFSFLSEKFELKNVFSYQESGIQLTWDRDKRISKLLKKERIKWREYQKDGVVRGIKNRDTWDQKWHDHINAEIIQNRYSSSQDDHFDHPFQLDAALEKSLIEYPESFQKPGEVYAWKYLRSFCEDRGKNYNNHISKPRESRKSCGRISPYLAWGNINIKQALQFVELHPNYTKYKKSFIGMQTRLKWHCHFIQKFENQCDYETLCVNRGYEQLEYTNNEKHIQAWKEGKTGFPLVDACMRCLKETGWVNFRMRARLVSMLSLNLDCDWRL